MNRDALRAIEWVKVVRSDGSFEAHAIVERPFPSFSGESLEIEVPSNYSEDEMHQLATRRTKELQHGT